MCRGGNLWVIRWQWCYPVVVVVGRERGVDPSPVGIIDNTVVILHAGRQSPWCICWCCRATLTGAALLARGCTSLYIPSLCGYQFMQEGDGGSMYTCRSSHTDTATAHVAETLGNTEHMIYTSLPQGVCVHGSCSFGDKPQ